jgi:hypothetical protein
VTIQSHYRSQFADLPVELVGRIFSKLEQKDLIACSTVSKLWQRVSDQDEFWQRFVSKNFWNGKTWIKQLFAKDKKEAFIIASFPRTLIEALGGLEKVVNLPYKNLGTRHVIADSIRLCDVSEPLTIGHVRFFLKNLTQLKASRCGYAFLAIRYINRKFDPLTKHLDVWLANKSTLLTIIVDGSEGGGVTYGPGTSYFPSDFTDVNPIGYIGRLVRGEPCGVPNSSGKEHSKATLSGESIVSLI